MRDLACSRISDTERKRLIVKKTDPEWVTGDFRRMSSLQIAARRAAGLIGRESRLVRRLRPAYESFLDWSAGGRGIPWSINGVTYRIDPHHRHRLGQNYDPPVADFLRNHVRPGA